VLIGRTAAAAASVAAHLGGFARLRTAAVTFVVAVVLLGASAGTPSANAAPSFAGTASADGVRVNARIPGFPVSDVPIDAGGPTAQVSVDSIGTSVGYAAFPDPGALVRSAPGLVVGLLAGGAAGFPPIPLPSLPDYPLAVASNSAGETDVSSGAGPYQLSATSKPDGSQAAATAGFQATSAGNAAVISSRASVTATEAGADAVGVSKIEGLTIGPLSIGTITSTATQSIDQAGQVVGSSKLEIAGLRIGGVAVTISSDAIELGSAAIPLPIGETLGALLSAAGIKATLQAEQRFDDRIVAPALVLEMPFTTPPIPNLGQFNGTATLVLGAASTSMSAGGVDSAALDPDIGEGEIVTPELPNSAPSADFSLTSPATVPGQSTLPATPRPEQAIGFRRGLDVRGVYLTIAVGALLAACMSRANRRFGV